MMSHPEKFSDGQPCWIDIATPDAEKRTALVTFLTELFGWTFVVGGPEMAYYSMAHANGRPVGAISEMAGVPSNWTTYLATADINKSAASFSQNGGAVLREPMQVMDLGQMAVVKDAVGAVVGLWQAEKFMGFGIVQEMNTPTWFDLQSDDPKRAGSFYRDVFGLTVKSMPDSDSAMIGTPDQQWFSVSPKQPNVPSCWNPVIQVDSISRIATELERLGATILMNDMPVPGGMVVVFADPVVHAPLICFEVDAHS